MSLLPEVESALLHAVRRDHQTRAHGGIVGTVRAWCADVRADCC